MKLQFTPQLGYHKKFQKKLKNIFLIQFLLMVFLCLAKNGQIRGKFQNFVIKYPKDYIIEVDSFLKRI